MYYILRLFFYLIIMVYMNMLSIIILMCAILIEINVLRYLMYTCNAIIFIFIDFYWNITLALIYFGRIFYSRY